MLYGFLGALSLPQVLGQGAQGQDWEERWGERGPPLWAPLAGGGSW